MFKTTILLAAALALATSVLADEVGFPKRKFSEYTFDDAASDRKAIAELYALVGLSVDCDKSPAAYDMALGGPVATVVLIDQLQPPLTKEEYHAGREAVIKAQAEGRDAWCQTYAVQMYLATQLVLHLAQERGLGPKK